MITQIMTLHNRSKELRGLDGAIEWTGTFVRQGERLTKNTTNRKK
jgi:hypothetical protein